MFTARESLTSTHTAIKLAQYDWKKEVHNGETAYTADASLVLEKPRFAIVERDMAAAAIKVDFNPQAMQYRVSGEHDIDRLNHLLNKVGKTLPDMTTDGARLSHPRINASTTGTPSRN